MAEAVAGLLTSAFVGIAKAKLNSAIAEQTSLLCNFGSDLEGMKDVLETISAALEDAERRSSKEKLVQRWLKRLKDAALDISGILEDYQDSSDQATAKMPGVLSCLPMAHKKIALANRMKTVRENLSKINKEFESFNFRQGTSTTIEQFYDERETTSRLPEEPIIGRDVEKQKIIDLLYADTNNNAIVIVPIYGLGGMGKSTLAQLVYNDDQFQKYDHRIWIYVSQDFNLLKIGSSMISQLQPGGCQQKSDTQEIVNNFVGNLLHGKKVLVVLDDLWEDRQTELDKLRRLLHVQGGIIRVIVTTRKEDIARKISTSKPYKLQPLKDDICWEIIKRSSKFYLNSNKEKLEEIGLDIAKKCGGVALAAQAIGFILRSKDDVSGWTKINNSDIWNEPSKDNDILPSLKLSFERMSPQLRICFSYCAMFQKGHNIVEDDLIHHWIALDFIEQSKGKEYIKILLEMSFLQVSKLPSKSDEHLVRYTMHDLVYDLARLTLDDELIVLDDAPGRNIRGQKYCHYSLLTKYDRTTNLANILSSKMRAIRFSDSGELDIPRNTFPFPKRLRTLDFSECSRIVLPDYIGRLKQLRCLITPRIKNKSLPKFMTELYKLQYLNINGSSQISELPESIGNLGCLMYLGLSGCSGISKLPESFGELKCMVHLDMSYCSGITELPDSLGNVRNLQHLNLSRCSSLQAIPESLCGLTQLQYLNLSDCRHLDRLPETIGCLVDLRYLDMSWCTQIREVPESFMKLQNLLHLDFTSCKNMLNELLPCLRVLTALQHLNLTLTYMFNICDANLNVLGNLTNLKYLSLSCCVMGTELDLVDFGTLTNLEHLDLSNSYNLACLPESIGTLTNLEHLDLSNNYDLACFPESIGNLKRLHTLDLSGCYKLKSLPESIDSLELKSLRLRGCSDELMHQASSAVHYTKSLPLFKVYADDASGCSNLPLLEDTHHASKLKILSLENARSLEEAKKVKLVDKHDLFELTLEWNAGADRQLDDIDLLEQLVPPRGLKHMSVQGYGSTSFPGWLMGISRHLTNLVSVELSNLRTCSNLPPLGQLPHLEKLELKILPCIKQIGREFCGGKGAFRRLAHFSIGLMDCLEEWNTTYSVEDGVEEFMFPVLERLEIWYCPMLRLKPCPPTFHECRIRGSHKVIPSLEEVDKIRHHSSPSRAIKLHLSEQGENCQSMRIFHHFPSLQEISISQSDLTSLPESMRHLTSLQSLTIEWCKGISAVPEWLGDLSSLTRLNIRGCENIKSLPSCLLKKPQMLSICGNEELLKWCESEENKTKLASLDKR